MQSYPLSLNADNGFVTTLNAAGDLFVYVSATTAGAVAELSVKSNLGGEVDIMPGQRFRLPVRNGEVPSTWYIKVKDGVSPVVGKLVIGAGEFDDANTLNTFKLDASFANNVKVTNAGAAQAVPVSSPTPLTVVPNGGSMPVTIQNAQIEVMNDTGNRIPISLDPNQVLNTSGNAVAYNKSYAVIGTSVASTAIPLLTPAENVNGAWLNGFTLIPGTNSGLFTVLAKASAPANAADGDVLFVDYATNGGGRYQLDIGKHGQVRVPPGKGIWYFSAAPDAAYLREALMTVL